jgi:hypothetical protein
MYEMHGYTTHKTAILTTARTSEPMKQLLHRVQEPKLDLLAIRAEMVKRNGQKLKR